MIGYNAIVPGSFVTYVVAVQCHMTRFSSVFLVHF